MLSSSLTAETAVELDRFRTDVVRRPAESTLDTSAAAYPPVITLNARAKSSVPAPTSVVTACILAPISLLDADVSATKSIPTPMPAPGVPEVVCVRVNGVMTAALLASSIVVASVAVVTVPVNVGEAPSILVAMAVDMSSNSVLSSVPFTTLEGLPDRSASFDAKLVVLL